MAERQTNPRPPVGPWQRFLALPNESVTKTLLVAIGVCLVCSLVVTTTAVLLQPVQQAHRARERSERMRAMVAGVPGLAEVVAGLEGLDLEARVVRLRTGQYEQGVDASTYDQAKAAQDPDRSVTLTKEQDVAGLGRIPLLATVYLLRERDELRLLILPVSGQGYASTLRGYLALDADLNTIRALTFYEQQETPGLGAQVEDPAWASRWDGKKIRDPSGRIRVRVATGEASPEGDAPEYEVDAISGATWTSNGVTNLLRFWLGDDGFGPYLARLRAGEAGAGGEQP